MQPRINYMDELNDLARDALLMLGILVCLAGVAWVIKDLAVSLAEECKKITMDAPYAQDGSDYDMLPKEIAMIDYDHLPMKNIEYLVFNKFNINNKLDR